MIMFSAQVEKDLLINCRLIDWLLIDFQVEEDLLTEKMKIKKVSDDLNQTFEDMINMSVWCQFCITNFHRHKCMCRICIVVIDANSANQFKPIFIDMSVCVIVWKSQSIRQIQERIY